MHHNIDIRVFVSEEPLGLTVKPITEVRKKYQRKIDRRECNSISCFNPISSCGQQEFKQGRFYVWYAILNSAVCQDCWLEMYDRQVDE